MKLQSWLELFQREFRQTLHDARRPFFLFGAALAYLLVFGMLAFFSLQRILIPGDFCDEFFIKLQVSKRLFFSPANIPSRALTFGP